MIDINVLHLHHHHLLLHQNHIHLRYHTEKLPARQMSGGQTLYITAQARKQ